MGDWILSGCTLAAVVESISLKSASEAYKRDTADKAVNTRKGEAKHLGHLCRLMGEDTKLDRIDHKAIKKYADKRRTEGNRHGGTISGQTVHKELLTFTQVWLWARRHRHVSTDCPVKDPHDNRHWAIRLPKPSRTLTFMTWGECEAKIAREQIPDDDRRKAFAGLYLDESQRDQLLAHVSAASKHPFVPVLFWLAAYAGMRRSEILNAYIEDVRFDDHLILIRQKKARKDLAENIRKCPMAPKLEEVLRIYLAKHHTGGVSLIVDEDGNQMSVDRAGHHFRSAIANSKWDVLRGFHTLRHSFASICLRKSIPIHVTAKWMGHSTQEMIELYQKTYAQDEQDWIKML
jgi:integrase